MHVSYLFGFFPDYRFRTALPDWSIELEMQYYAVFPFLMMIIASFGWLRGVLPFVIISSAFAVAFHEVE